MTTLQTLDYQSINRAFSKQAEHYDEDDFANPILIDWRQQVYTHVNGFLKPGSYLLELNAGTGIDALHFANEGHRVHATDLSDGMVKKINQKIRDNALLGKLTCQQCSFENLNLVSETNFDYIFSNFGGLNCVDDLSKVTRHFQSLLKPGGYVTLVVMPPVCLWEWLWIFKGHTGKAFRRLSKDGASAHLEGEFFQTFYHSVKDIKKALGKNFKLVKCEGLGSLAPPPSKVQFAVDFPRLYKLLQLLDTRVRFGFPFNRWADHVIVTFQYTL
jgi:ubiquinone/menaquinone biosynthesis C-methylase UbiE